MKYNILRKLIKKPWFSLTETRLRGLNIYRYQLNLWVKKGDLLRIKRGIYVFSDRKADISPEDVSALIYEPSYISMEYALRYYGFIPEAVFAVTCITTKANRDFKNIYGYYIYRNLKADLFFGYRVIKTIFGRYLFADPEKALLDFLYLNPGIHNQEDLAGFRFNFELIGKTIDLDKFRFFSGIFNNKRINILSELIIKLCSPSNS